MLLAGLVAKMAFAGGPEEVAEAKIELKPKKGPESIVTRKHKKGVSLKDSKALTIRRGDLELGFGGRTKIEHFLQKNAYMLNKNLPDENEYFKERMSLMFDGSYGQEKYGYKAVQMYAEIRHKGVWGKALSYADKDTSASIGTGVVRFKPNDETTFGLHSHTSGKTLLWFNEAWLQFSPNAVFGDTSHDHLHFIKLGWYEFTLGRGIALGGMYGTTKEGFGLYSYPEDKGAPGINIHGTLIKDKLAYDLYYAKFEERNKGFFDSVNLEKQHIVGLKVPFRGESKDDDFVGARIQWTPLAGTSAGSLEIEPYVFYNSADDQTVERRPDAKTQWGSYGCSLEYAYSDFEIGGETALNYGTEKLYNIDRNVAENENVNGMWGSKYSRIHTLTHPFVPTNATDLAKAHALRTPEAMEAAHFPAQNGVDIMFPNDYVDAKGDSSKAGTSTGYSSGLRRFRPAYNNKLRGWMCVLDGAYNIKKWNLKMALSWGYASGDANPHDVETNKTYKGFVGLHEGYCGKRVKSVLILDERLLFRPTIISVRGKDVAKATPEMVFSDLQLVGAGLTWTPQCCVKDLSFNPNVIGFWKVHNIKGFIADSADLINGGHLSDKNARNYMGTEINLMSKCSLIKDLTMYANIAVFVPGAFFKDVKGVPIDGRDAVIQSVLEDWRNNENDFTKFRLGTDTAYHVNIGFEYKF